MLTGFYRSFISGPIFRVSRQTCIEREQDALADPHGGSILHTQIDGKAVASGVAEESKVFFQNPQAEGGCRIFLEKYIGLIYDVF